MNNKGQSTIEFILTLAFLFGFIFVYAQIALNYTNGYLLHYATFMASRSYLVHDHNSNTVSDSAAQNDAREVFKKIVPSADITLNFNDPNPNMRRSLYTGVYINFQQLFSLSNIVGGRVPMDLKSESFIGREPTRSECLGRIHDAFAQLTGDETFTENVTFEDNGC